MGTAQIIAKRQVLANLFLNYSDQIIIEEASNQDDFGDEYLCKVSSKKLPKGFNGMQFVIIEQFDIRFKPDIDV